MVAEQGGSGTHAEAVFNMVNCILGAGEASFAKLGFCLGQATLSYDCRCPGVPLCL